MGQCEETVYAGRSQYDRIHGHRCTRKATAQLRSTHGGEDRRMCERHAKIAVERYDYRRES